MKKMIYAMFIFFVLSFQSMNSFTIKYICKNVSRNGCKSSDLVADINDEDKLKSVITLKCKGKGNEKFDILMPIDNMLKFESNYTDLRDSAITAIYSGRFNDSLRQNVKAAGINWSKEVRWTAADTSNYKITIQILPKQK
jgi:hypothetical protein